MARHRINEEISTSPVRVVTQAGELLHAMPIGNALQLARNAGLDLVEIAPDEQPVICRIMDYDEFRRSRNTASLLNILFRRRQ